MIEKFLLRSFTYKIQNSIDQGLVLETAFGKIIISTDFETSVLVFLPVADKFGEEQ